MTGQVNLDSYADAGVLTAVDLVNALAPASGEGPRREDLLPSIKKILSADPPSAAMLRSADAPGFLALAQALRGVFEDLRRKSLDGAAARVNDLLAKHPAYPHLAKEQGRWRMHHHPMNMALVPMCSAICAEAMARMIGAGHAHRFGTCEAPDCGRVYFDLSKNGSRRFCSVACQNRVKAAAFRLRQAGGRAARRAR
jgi:predicted RNA-binding Zn ribbon-like protein